MKLWLEGDSKAVNVAKVFFLLGSFFSMHPHYQIGESKTVYRPMGKRPKRSDFRSWIGGEKWGHYSLHPWGWYQSPIEIRFRTKACSFGTCTSGTSGNSKQQVRYKDFMIWDKFISRHIALARPLSLDSGVYSPSSSLLLRDKRSWMHEAPALQTEPYLFQVPSLSPSHPWMFSSTVIQLKLRHGHCKTLSRSPWGPVLELALHLPTRSPLLLPYLGRLRLPHSRDSRCDWCMFTSGIVVHESWTGLYICDYVWGK